MTFELRCLAIRQPWAWLIIAGKKTIENRSRETSYRGRLLIHASLRPDKVDERWLKRFGCDVQGGDLLLGGVIGSVELVDTVRQSNNRWFDGPFGYVLRNPRSLPFVKQRGQLGFFRPSGSVLDVVSRQSRGKWRNRLD